MSTRLGTIQTYDRIAEVYLERNRNRNPILDDLNRFALYLESGNLILDVGCGPGFDAELLREKGYRVVGVEFSNQMINVGKCYFPGNFIRADMVHLPFREGIDGLWVNASLLHIERDAVSQTLQGFYRTLKSGGILYVSVQKGAGEKWRLGAYGEPVSRWFTYWQAEDLKKAVANVGFEILDICMNEQWLKCFARKISD
jgi:SAM-dependent methyltransferase